MDEATGLDRAHAAMQADDAQGRMRFYQQIADTDLFVVLKHAAVGDKIVPDLFDLEEGRFVLVFDHEERLSRFTARVTPFAGLSGRMLMQMLGGQGIGLALNLGVAPSSILVPAEAVDWLNQVLAAGPDRVEARIASWGPPAGLPEPVLAGLGAKLAGMGGLVATAYLVGVRYRDGHAGHLLGFVDADAQAQAALAKAVGEALTFAGAEAGIVDVGFFAADDPVVAQLAASGLRLDLPRADLQIPPAPTSDAKKPPTLRRASPKH